MKRLIKQVGKQGDSFVGYIHFIAGKAKAYEVSITVKSMGHKVTDQRLVAKLVDQETADQVLQGLYDVYTSHRHLIGEQMRGKQSLLVPQSQSRHLLNSQASEAPSNAPEDKTATASKGLNK